MNYKGIKLDLERDSNFSEQGIKLMSKYYQQDGKEGVQKAIARAANCFSFGDKELAQRIYDYASKHWFFFSSPILSNAIDGEWTEDYWKSGKKISEVWTGGKPKAMPIACFLSLVPDTIDGQIATAAELSYLSVMGGGTAMHSAIRATSDKAPGPVPYFKTIDGVMGYYRQGKTRRGSTAIYLDVSHPDIVEFINMRKPSGGDPARKIDNRAGVHCAVNLSDAFQEAVQNDKDWNLVCPHTGDVRDTIRARTLWGHLLEAREFTGEPYFYFIDTAARAFPAIQKALGLRTNGSNLCSEITLATSESRTAVCCLSSVNLEKWDEWKYSQLVEDLVRFLDNVIEWFLEFAPETLARAKRSAKAERALGIGAMGFHNYLMKNLIPFESGGFGSASQVNYQMFKGMRKQAEAETAKLADERGEPSDLIGSGRRNSHLFAIAPNANSSVLCNTSPSIEPILSNAYTQKSRAGIDLVVNKFLVEWLNREGWTLMEDLKIPLDEISFWKEVITHNGSIQHLDFIPAHIRKVFKTAWEIDQHWVVVHAGNRQEFICQAQSLNVFFLPGTDRAYINSVHWKAFKEKKVKSMYYFRTGSEGAADTVKVQERVALQDAAPTGASDCLSCEG